MKKLNKNAETNSKANAETNIRINVKANAKVNTQLNAKHRQTPGLKSIQTQFQLASGSRCLEHGGEHRKKRHGRGRRAISCKESLHVVFKINRIVLKTQSLRTHQNFKLSHEIIQKYADRFFVKIEQISIQGDHIHCLVRTVRRSFFHHFFRVVSGQIAQQFEKTDKLRHVVDERFKSVTDTLKNALNNNANNTVNKQQNTVRRKLRLWMYRPFSRVVRGYKAYKVVRNYIQLNEKEALGIIPYKKNRLRGLSLAEWEILWA